MNVQLSTGKTISISSYEYYFMLKDDDLDEFFQSCVADDLGTFLENPFSQRASMGKLEIDELSEDTHEGIE